MTRAAAALVAVLCALGLSACGGDGDGDGKAATETRAPAAVLAHANAICADFLRETKQLGKGALADPPSTALELTTERLIRPSIPLLESAATRMQALEPAADDLLFSLYADLFDPAVVLAEERLQAGLEGDAVESKRLEAALSSIDLEQRQAARILGLPNCDVDFQNVLLSSLTE
jgi:hypothetical protein